MNPLRSAWSRVAGLFGFNRRNAEIDEELGAHLEMLVDDYRRRGLSEPDARRLAGAEFGSVAAATQAYRDRRGVPVIENWLRDIRYGLRSLWHARVLSVAMILVLALGVGVTTTLATVFHAVLFRPLPVPEAHRVVKVAQVIGGQGNRRVDGHASQLSWPEFDLYRSSTQEFSDIAVVRVGRATWVQSGERHPIVASLVTPNYFRLLGTVPAAGRLFDAGDARSNVVVISHRFWTRSFAQDRDAIGRAITLDRSQFTVVGIAESGFTGTDVDRVDVWLPLEAAVAARGQAEQLADSSLSWLPVIGRLAPNASMESATAEAQVIASRFDGLHPGQRSTILMTPASRVDSAVQAGDEGMLIGIGVAVSLFAGVVLLVCTSNAAALLLARGAARQREFAVRLALGASRSRVIQQLLIESLILAASAAGLGLCLTMAVLRLAAASLPMPDFFETFVPDITVVAFALTATFGAAVLFGVVPAIFTTRIDPMPVLKGDSAGLGVRMPASRLRHWLVTAQVTTSLVLLVLAALLGRNLQQALRVDGGIAWSPLYSVHIDVSPGAVAAAARADIEQRVQLALDSRAEFTAGVTALSPFAGVGLTQARSATASTLTPVNVNRVSAGYFRALSVSPIAGRAFGRNSEESEVIVNARLARKFWSDERAAIGQTLMVLDDRRSDPKASELLVTAAEVGPALRPVTVIGVIPTLATTEPGQMDGPMVYQPLRSTSNESATFVVRAPSRVALQSMLTSEIGSRPDATLTIASLEERLRERTEPMRIAALIAGGVGMLTLLIAGAGIYGVVAHAVISRRHEIGVHLALGAPRARVLRLVIGSSSRAILTGAIAGMIVVVIGAMAASQTDGPSIAGGAALDPIAMLAGLVFLVCVSGLAAYWPARRIGTEAIRLRE